MTIGGLLAILVIFAVFGAFVFGSAAPAWLPLLLIGMLAVAIVLSPYPLRTRTP